MAREKIPRPRKSVADAMSQVETLAWEIRPRGIRLKLDVTDLKSGPGAGFLLKLLGELAGSVDVLATLGPETRN